MPVGTDLMCIPVNARSPGTALMFIDWMLEPEQRRPERRLERLPAAGRGRQAGVREAGQGRAVDRRQPRRRSATAGWSTGSTTPTTARSGPDLDRGEGDVSCEAGRLRAPMTAGRFWDSLPAPRRDLAAAAVRGPDAASCSRSRSATSTSSAAPSTSSGSTTTPTPSTRSTSRCCCARSASRWRRRLLCLLLGYPIAYYIARYGGRYKHLLIALLVIPFFVNYLVRTYAWVALLVRRGAGQQRAQGPRADRDRHPDDQHAVRGDRRPRLRLPRVHDPADLRARSSGWTAR